MVAFIDAHREEYGVEPICAQLPMAPSTYYEHKARQVDAGRAPARVRRDRELESQIQRVWDENFQVYGVRKTWRELNREDIAVARPHTEKVHLAMSMPAATTLVPCDALILSMTSPL